MGSVCGKPLAPYDSPGYKNKNSFPSQPKFNPTAAASSPYFLPFFLQSIGASKTTVVDSVLVLQKSGSYLISKPTTSKSAGLAYRTCTRKDALHDLTMIPPARWGSSVWGIVVNDPDTGAAWLRVDPACV